MSEQKKLDNLINHPDSGEITIKQILQEGIDTFVYLRSKWFLILLFGIIGGMTGFINAYLRKPLYNAKITFALEEEKGGSGGLAGAMGLASSLGLDLGNNAGGAFSGANLIELMKSRRIIEKSLLNPIFINNKVKSLAQEYIEIYELNKNWPENSKLSGIQFLPNANRSGFNMQQDSILGKLYTSIISPEGILTIAQKDKKVGILTVEVNCENELFAKAFAESIVKEISEFYIETKIKKSKANVAILQKQTDSIRSELNAAITGVAIANDNTFNLNPAMQVPKAIGLKRQIDVQANTAILTQLVTNLELSKLALRKETPLIQVIDAPILPLTVEKVSKLKSLAIGGIFGGFLIILFLVARRFLNKIIKG